MIIIQHNENNHNSRLIIAAATLLITISAQHTAMAEDFNFSLRDNLNQVCPNDSFQAGGNLRRVCDDIIAQQDPRAGPVGSVFSSIGALPESAGVLSSTQQHLRSSREAEEEKREGGRGGYAYAFDSAERFAQRGDLQLPPAGGASPDIVFGLSSGASVFLSAGAYALDHHQNVFEDGYEAQIPTVTVGADYQVNEWLLAGLALNYTNYDGNFVDGSEFDKHIFGPLLYATFIPFQGAFADVVLGYARQENRTNRLVGSEHATPNRVPVEGRTSADYSVNQYTAGIFAGYDQPIGPLLIGPRLGFAVSHESFESFQEDGNTGLELRYDNLDRTSVQSSLGVQASVVIETAYGVVVPQAAVAWVHEYANNDRNIDARLVEAAPIAPSFTFQREPPARDWANIGIAVSAVLKNGLQPFIQFTTMQGNENFVSYGGTVGVRLGL